MAEIAYVYGTIIDPEWEKGQQEREYLYLEALIKAEQLNPNDDYDGERRYDLLKKIAKSGLDLRPYRNNLIDLLESDTEE